MSQISKAEDLNNTDDLIGTIIFTVVVLAALGVFVLVLLFAYQKKYIKHLKTQENLKLENERNLLNAQIEVKEQTLKDTGAELHDNVGQLLSLAKLQLSKSNDESAKDARELIQIAIIEVRELSHHLNLDWINEAGFLELVKAEIIKVEKTGFFKILIDFPEEELYLKKENKIVLLRCVQEAIQNIVKHAEATQIEFKISLENDYLLVKIEDNGKGFHVEGVRKSAGLTNMENRIKSIGGTFSVQSQFDKGCKCTFSIPLEKDLPA